VLERHSERLFYLQRIIFTPQRATGLHRIRIYVPDTSRWPDRKQCEQRPGVRNRQDVRHKVDLAGSVG
jgi:hypothetical protein